MASNNSKIDLFIEAILGLDLFADFTILKETLETEEKRSNPKSLRGKLSQAVFGIYS